MFLAKTCGDDQAPGTNLSSATAPRLGSGPPVLGELLSWYDANRWNHKVVEEHFEVLIAVGESTSLIIVPWSQNLKKLYWYFANPEAPEQMWSQENVVSGENSCVYDQPPPSFRTLFLCFGNCSPGMMRVVGPIHLWDIQPTTLFLEK